MTSKIFSYLKTYDVDPFKVDRLVVSAFISCNKINIKKNLLLKKYIIQPDSKDFEQVTGFIAMIEAEIKHVFNFEDLIELFEFIISPADKEINGAVYTPKYIRDYILGEVTKKINASGKKYDALKYGDIACGCGAFLFDLAKLIQQKTKVSYFDIFKNNLFAIDITSYSIRRTELLLLLLAVSSGEDRAIFETNLFVGNSLTYNWIRNNQKINANQGFDVIVGNPPYVGSSSMKEETKDLIARWSVSASGKVDLYIPFFQIGLEALKDNGVLGYITVNTFFQSVNGRLLREYIAEKGYGLKIVNFGGEQIFKGRSTYTCICIFEKTENKNIQYIKRLSNKIHLLTDKDFYNINYDTVDNHNGWLLAAPEVVQNIKKIESTGQQLEELFQIKNGFATLRNDIYVFTPERQDKKYYYLLYESIEYPIEKGICRDAIKPNTLKSAKDISKQMEKIIFPYTIKKTKATPLVAELIIIPEVKFKKKYPCAYSYLAAQKTELKQRDKKKKKYETWYAFGRNQALTLSGHKLLFPYIAEQPYFVYTNNQDLLFYNGYALMSDNSANLLIASKVLNSSVFWYYISNSSKPYEQDYFSLAKNYVKRFGIYPFTEEEKQYLLQESDQEKLDQFLIKKYEVNI